MSQWSDPDSKIKIASLVCIIHCHTIFHHCLSVVFNFTCVWPYNTTNFQFAKHYIWLFIGRVQNMFKMLMCIVAVCGSQWRSLTTYMRGGSWKKISKYHSVCYIECFLQILEIFRSLSMTLRWFKFWTSTNFIFTILLARNRK